VRVARQDDTFLPADLGAGLGGKRAIVDPPEPAFLVLRQAQLRQRIQQIDGPAARQRVEDQVTISQEADLQIGPQALDRLQVARPLGRGPIADHQRARRQRLGQQRTGGQLGGGPVGRPHRAHVGGEQQHRQR
jgi:hypothetical protein